ncbi:MAG: hypothetical protein E6772_15210 [Dysgonomonas sp.]|nr:hypothetical protein [Dysgonomonas sp.]
MSSRKDLKKQINNSMSLLYSDCILYKVFSKNANQQKADELISKIAGVHNDFLSRINVTEGKEVKNRVKSYYKKLRVDLKAQIDEIGKEIQNLD